MLARSCLSKERSTKEILARICIGWVNSFDLTGPGYKNDALTQNIEVSGLKIK